MSKLKVATTEKHFQNKPKKYFKNLKLQKFEMYKEASDW